MGYASSGSGAEVMSTRFVISRSSSPTILSQLVPRQQTSGK